jgi:hypothetical protein
MISGIIGISAVTVAALLFWQPAMGWDRPEKRCELSSGEEYVNKIDGSINEEKYEEAISLLIRREYSSDELPMRYWKDKIAEKLKETKKQLKSLKVLSKTLESVLKD